MSALGTSLFTQRNFLLALGAIVAMAMGALTGYSWQLAVAVSGLALVGFLFVRLDTKAELLVGLYWGTLAIKSTVYSQVQIGGLYFPFYGAFLFFLVLKIFKNGVRFNVVAGWLLVGLLIVVLASFLGFSEPIDSDVIQRLLTILICPLVLMQFRSSRGLNLVASLGSISSIYVSGWVILSAVQGDFEYRGGVTANENMVAFVIGLGFVLTAARGIYNITSAGFRWLGILRLVLSGAMAYSVLLLSSRGMLLALVAAVIVMAIQLVLQDRKRTTAILVLVLLTPLGLLLPGGSSVLDRFQGESVESAGDRTPIWNATASAYLAGNPVDLVLGAGFDSSRRTVLRTTAIHTSSHNAFLTTILEYGLVGLVLFLGVHLFAGLGGARGKNHFGLMAMGLVVYLLGSGLTATTTDGFNYWLALGFALALASFGPTAPSEVLA